MRKHNNTGRPYSTLQQQRQREHAAAGADCMRTASPCAHNRACEQAAMGVRASHDSTTSGASQVERSRSVLHQDCLFFRGGDPSRRRACILYIDIKSREDVWHSDAMADAHVHGIVVAGSVSHDYNGIRMRNRAYEYLMH